MNETDLVSKKQLRTERSWTHKQVRDLGVPEERIKTGWKGRPAYGFKLSDIIAVEKARK